MKDFKTLRVWQEAHQLALKVFRVTDTFPRKYYSVINQIQRAALSVPTNIAEGCGRDTGGELRRFLQIAMGSVSEVEYLLLMSHDLGMIKPDNYQELNSAIISVKRMLATFIQKLKADS